MSESVVHGYYEEVRSKASQADGGSKHHEHSSRDEDFVATILLMIKKEEAQPSSSEEADNPTSPVRRFESLSHTCEEHKIKHVTCPSSCPRRKVQQVDKFNDQEENTNLHDEENSSGLDDEHRVNFSNDRGYSSDELFEEINYTSRGHKIRSVGSSNGVQGKKSRKLSKEDVDISYSNGRTRGFKRKSIPRELDSDSGLQKRKYAKQRKVVKGIEMFWNPPTASYGIQKPKSPDQYTVLVSWSLSQLPRKSGTIEDVFSTVKENGWPELKKGNSRETISARNTITKILCDHFVEKTQNEKGESIYTLTEAAFEHGSNVDEDIIGSELIAPAWSCTKHQLGDCNANCSYRRKGVSTRRREIHDLQDGLGVRESKTKRETRHNTPLIAEDPAEEVEPEEIQNDISEATRDNSPATPPKIRKKVNSGATKKAAKESGRGRRWVRFACEKHRREHARCPDNCIMRKKSYVNDDNTIDEDMDEDSADFDDSKSQGEDEIIVDESST
jgi:hypothetical protein